MYTTPKDDETMDSRTDIDVDINKLIEDNTPNTAINSSTKKTPNRLDSIPNFS